MGTLYQLWFLLFALLKESESTKQYLFYIAYKIASANDKILLDGVRIVRKYRKTEFIR